MYKYLLLLSTHEPTLGATMRTSMHSAPFIPSSGSRIPNICTIGGIDPDLYLYRLVARRRDKFNIEKSSKMMLNSCREELSAPSCWAGCQIPLVWVFDVQCGILWKIGSILYDRPSGEDMVLVTLSRITSQSAFGKPWFKIIRHDTSISVAVGDNLAWVESIICWAYWTVLGEGMRGDWIALTPHSCRAEPDTNDFGTTHASELLNGRRDGSIISDKW